MKKLLEELEAKLASLQPSERAKLAGAFTTLVQAVGASTTALRGVFRPSTAASVGMMSDLMLAMSGGQNLVVKAKKLAPKIGPHVTAIVQTL